MDIIRDIAAAFGLLTRLPVGAVPPRSEGAWAWPLTGLAVGFAAAGAGLGARHLLGLPADLAALASLAVGALLTGGLHEDGLADCADGFWGGRTRLRRLEIMKDSRIGSYGVLALILVTLFRWQALAALLAEPGFAGAVIAAACLSRAPMAALSALLPNARGTGLSAAVGRATPAAAVLAAGLALALALAATGPAALAMVLTVALTSLALALLARAKIGGQTGDVLGAAQQLSEAAALATAAALLAG